MSGPTLGEPPNGDSPKYDWVVSPRLEVCTGGIGFDGELTPIQRDSAGCCSPGRSPLHQDTQSNEISFFF